MYIFEIIKNTDYISKIAYINRLINFAKNANYLDIFNRFSKYVISFNLHVFFKVYYENLS